MYPGQIHRLNQAQRTAGTQQQQQQQQQQQPSASVYTVQQQPSQTLYTVQQQGAGLQAIVQQTSVSNNQVLQLSIKAKKLKAADWNGKSDPYLEFYRLEQNGWTKVHSTPVQFKTLKPVWTGLSISLDALCYGDRNRPILLRCFDYDEGQDPDHLGDCQFTVQDLLKSGKFKIDLKPITPSLFHRSTGRLAFFNVSVSAAASPNASRSFQQQPQLYQQQQPQQYQQPSQTYVQQQPQPAQKSPGGYPGVVYRAGNTQPVSTVSYGAQYQAAPLTVTSSQSSYTNPQQGYVGRQSYGSLQGGYSGNQAVYSSSMNPISQISPISSSVYSSNLSPTTASQSMYASNGVSGSGSRPPLSSNEIDNLPPPPSYDELFSKK